MILWVSLGLYPSTCWLTISDRRTGGITIDKTNDTLTHRLEYLREIRPAQEEGEYFANNICTCDGKGPSNFRAWNRIFGCVKCNDMHEESEPTGRLQKVLADIKQAAWDLDTFEVYEAVFNALDTVAYWDIEECVDVDDLVKELETQAEWYLDKAATKRAEEALAIQQRRLDAGL